MSLPDIHLLLVEDDPNDVELILRALRKLHLADRVFVVRDGAEALDFLFASGPFSPRHSAAVPKVVLLDLKLPKLHGFDVLERLRADPRTCHIPVVALSSSREDSDVQRSYALGVNSYVVKPVEAEKFAETVSQLGLYWALLNQTPRSF